MGGLCRCMEVQTASNSDQLGDNYIIALVKLG